jgi:hypothetical protein
MQIFTAWIFSAEHAHDPIMHRSGKSFTERQHVASPTVPPDARQPLSALLTITGPPLYAGARTPAATRIQRAARIPTTQTRILSKPITA